MPNPRRHHHNITLLHNRLNPPRILLATEAKPSTTVADAQDLVSGAVEVRGRVHGIAPLWCDDADVVDVGLDGGW